VLAQCTGSRRHSDQQRRDNREHRDEQGNDEASHGRALANPATLNPA
jgi:hypothetical protein